MAAFATSTRGDYALMYSATLASTALMSLWQARNHGRRREMLACLPYPRGGIAFLNAGRLAFATGSVGALPGLMKTALHLQDSSDGNSQAG